MKQFSKTHKISVGGELGRRIDVTISNNLMKLNVAGDFLAPLQEKNGGYIGLGMLLSAASRFAAYTKDPQVLTLCNHVAAKTQQAQEQDGYIGFKKPADRLWTLFDPDELSQFLIGLVYHYQITDDKNSLTAAERLGDWVIRQYSAHPGRVPADGRYDDVLASLGIEYGMMVLYEATQERRYLDFCVQQRRLVEWDGPIVLGRWGPIEGHAYAYLMKCCAQLRLFAMQPDPRLLRPARRALDFMMAQDGLVITGAVSDIECWHNSQEGLWNLGETCASAYIINLADELLRLENSSFYGDLMERVIYNTLFAAQSPDGRQLRYYTAFDGPRSYWGRDTYCCPNNYRRIISELPQFIYYNSSPGLTVNLYTSSTASFELDDGTSLTVRQETDYPYNGRVVIRLEPSQPASFPFRLRIPRWCNAPGVGVNGQAHDADIKPGAFLVLQRKWKAGDTVQLEFPMPWRLVQGRKCQAGRVAIMRGPLVFCLNRSRHASLANVDLRHLVIDPATLNAPVPDSALHPGGLKCRLQAWQPDLWHSFSGPADMPIELTEFTDPGGEAIYFKTLNPAAKNFVEDELYLARKE